MKWAVKLSIKSCVTDDHKSVVQLKNLAVSRIQQFFPLPAGTYLGWLLQQNNDD